MSSYVLALDIGTQGTKAVLYDDTLHPVQDTFEEANIIDGPQPGLTYQQPDDIMGSVERTVQRLLSDTDAKGEDVSVIAVTGKMLGIIGVAEDGSAATNYDEWRYDCCCRHMDTIREKAGDKFTKITGAPVIYSLAPKVLWWKEDCPEDYAKIAKFVPIHAFVAMQMCGLGAADAYTDWTSLSVTGFADTEKKAWSDELLNLFGVDKGKMPKICAPSDTAGKVSAAFASATGLKEGTPVVCGLSEPAAALFGCGVTPGGSVCIPGSQSALAASVTSYCPDTANQSLVQICSPEDGVWYSLGYVASGALSLRWYRDTFTGEPDATYEGLDKEAADVPVGSQGVMYIAPFSTRSEPGQADFRGSFLGLSWKSSRAHLYRAIMEGASYCQRHYMDLMEGLFGDLKLKETCFLGGAADSDLFNQIKADVLNVQISACENISVAAIGAAIVAGRTIGLYAQPHDAIEDATKTVKRFDPKPENVKAYEPFVKAHSEIWNKLAGVYEALVYRG